MDGKVWGSYSNRMGSLSTDSLNSEQSFFVSDLHGRREQYRKLFQKIIDELPAAVFLGGDLFPSGRISGSFGTNENFVTGFLAEGFLNVRKILADRYPRVFMILGNDDLRIQENAVRQGEESFLWEYIHNRKTRMGGFTVLGYAPIPPSPFWLKDWERYDVSRYVDPGAVAPDEGYRSLPVSDQEIQHSTMQSDLEALVGHEDLSMAIMLFHAPPYQTNLDRAALDGVFIDHAPADVHVGSIAIRRLIESRQPLVTLHGHVHESARLTGSWMERLGRTHCFSAAHDGPELALVVFDPDCPEMAVRVLI
jgi:uncharacterized protein